MMKKRTTQTLPLVFSVLLLLVFVTASARARSNPNPAPPIPGEIVGQIRWKKDMGLIPIGPGNKQASTSACSAFFIFAATLGMGPEKSKVLAYSPGSTSQPKEQEEYYVCTYSMQVPLDTGLLVIPGIGDVDLLPKMTRQSYYSTDQWIGGTHSRPPAGWRRGFNDFATVNRQPGSKSNFFRFEMIYVHGDNPNPTLDSSTPLSEEGASPLLRRASSFAGVWRALRGTTSMTLKLQQTGDQVTGQFERDVAGSTVVSVSEGIVVGNTLRFKFKLAPSDRSARGSGELVLAEDGKSFKGYIAGAATSGTFVQP